MTDLTAICRLLDEDPYGWYSGYSPTEGEFIYHLSVGYRIRFDAHGANTINGFVLGWWGRFVLKRALRRRDRRIVDRYLREKVRRDLATAEAEADRLLATA